MDMEAGTYGIGSGPSSIGSTTEVGTGASVQVRGGPEDTLSQAEAAVVVGALLAAFPHLPAPSLVPQNESSNSSSSSQSVGAVGVGINPALFSMQIENMISQITTQQLQSWGGQLQQQREEDDRYRNSDGARRSAEVNSGQEQIRMQNTGTGQDLGVNSQTYLSINGISGPGATFMTEGLTNYQNQVSNGNPAAAGSQPFAIANFVVPGLLVSGIIDVASTAQVPVNPAIDSSFFTEMINNPQNTTMIPSDMRAELGLLGAVFASGAVTYAAAVSTGQAIGGGTKPNEPAVAQNYGNKVLSLVSSPQFTNFLTAFYTPKTENNQPLSTQQQQTITERINILKLSLIGTALMALYKSTGGSISGPDFLGMITGTTKPQNSTEAQLVAAFQQTLPPDVLASLQGENVQLAPGDQIYMNFVQGMSSYADDNPGFSSFLNIDNLFASLGSPITFVGAV